MKTETCGEPRWYRKLPAEVRDRAGLYAYRQNRETGTHVGLYHADEAGIDSDPGNPWALVCEEHGHLCTWPTRAAAASYQAHPTEWCPVCSGQFDPETGEWTEVHV